MEDNKNFEELKNESDESTESKAEAVQDAKPADKKKNLIIIAVCVLVIAVAVVAAVLVIRGSNLENGGENNAATIVEVVTDESGEAVTDNQGNQVTEIVTEQGETSSETRQSGSLVDPQNNGENAENEATTSLKAEERTLKIYVTTPLEGDTEDVLIIYVNGEEDSRYDILLDGNEYFFETENEYKGDVEVTIELENYKIVSVLQIDKFSDTNSIVMPLNHVEQGEIG